MYKRIKRLSIITVSHAEGENELAGNQTNADFNYVTFKISVTYHLINKNKMLPIVKSLKKISTKTYLKMMVN